MSEEKKRVHKKKYAVLSHETTRAFLDAGGFYDVSQDVLPLLGEDAMYRIRQLVQVTGAAHCPRVCSSIIDLFFCTNS